MAKQDIGVGTTANDGTGDNLRAGAQKVNANFAEVYTLLGDGTTLPSDTVTLNTATQTLTNKTLTSPKINEDVAVTATATEINLLDGVTSTTAELNHTDGVTSNIQTQLDTKASNAFAIAQAVALG